MGDVEGAGHSQSQTGKGLFLGLRNRLDQRSQQDQSRVGEDGNGDQEAGDGQCDLLILAVQRLDEGVCHDLGGVGLLHDLTHHTAKGDHKADSGQRVAEARFHGVQQRHQIHARQHPDGQRRHQQSHH